MRYFIFATREGYTYQPGSNSIEPDIENCQVLGIEKGTDAQDAFHNLTKMIEWLIDSSFDVVHAYELKRPRIVSGFSLSEDRLAISA